MKVINDLLGYKDLKIVQNSDWFSFSLDSVLLPNFVTINKTVNNILDIGTGNAPIPLILTKKTNANIVGIEIQKEIFDLAKETLKINNLEKKIQIINDDIKNIDRYFNINFFDIILCNPPYFKVNEDSKFNDDPQKTIARHEIKINLENIISISSQYLKNGGALALVHRTERLSEIIILMKKYNIEPKKIQFIYPKVNHESNMILIEGRKNGNGGIKVLSPIIAHNEDGVYTDQISQFFE